MAAKRILIFSLSYFPRYVGGAEVAVKEITDRITQDECIFDMITLDKDGPRKEKIGNVTVYRLGDNWLNRTKFLGKLNKYVFIISAYRKAVILHRIYRYDSIWSIMANYGGFAALFFKKTFPSVRFILTLQEGDPIKYIKRRVALFYPLFKEIFKKTDCIQAISQYLAQFAKDMGYKKEPVVLPNGVAINQFSRPYSAEEKRQARERYGFTGKDKIIVTTSRLVSKNGVSDIISALTDLSDEYKLLIFGTGILEERLKNQVLEQKLNNRVVFVGYVSHEELPLYLHASDIFVRPSLSEGLGNSFLEAMAAGLPVVATPVGGIPDFLRERETGLFCATHDPKSISNAVRALADNSLRTYIVAQAKAMVEREYSWDMLATRMQQLF